MKAASLFTKIRSKFLNLVLQGHRQADDMTDNATTPVAFLTTGKTEK